MTAAVLDRPASLFDYGATELTPEAPAFGGGITLEERLDAVLRTASTSGTADCPLCHAQMTYTGEGAACGACGARLS